MTSALPKSAEGRCPICARANGCGVAQGGANGACWCFSVQVSRELLDWVEARGLNGRCLCADCAAGDVPSPCIGECRLDDANASCLGCGRTVAEITGWRSRGPVEKATVLLRLQGK